jgi:luciferase-like monooxygenase
VDVLGEVTAWEAVTSEPLPGGGAELRYRGDLLGRVLGDGTSELAFQPRVRAMLVETGRAGPHADPRLVRFAGPPDEMVELFRLAWERARVARVVRDARGG